MKVKNILLLLFLFTGLCSGYAQRQFRKPLKSSSESYSLSGSNYIGLKLGSGWNVLSKNDLSKTTYLGHWGYLVGITGEHLFNQFSIGLDACWIQRGTRMRRQSNFQVSLTEEGTITKEISTAFDVASISIPLTYYLGTKQGKRITPYLYLAPTIEIPLPYCFRWDNEQGKLVFAEPVLTSTMQITTSTNNTTLISQTFLPRLNAAVSAGVGLMVRIPVGGSDFRLKVNAGGHQGLINLATENLKDEGIVILTQSLEASVTLLFQLKKPLHDACHTFRKQKR